MAECELLEGCLFFNNKRSLGKTIDDVYKDHYCRGDKSLCARFMIASRLGRDKVPAGLFPNMTDKAQDILKKV